MGNNPWKPGDYQAVMDIYTDLSCETIRRNRLPPRWRGDSSSVTHHPPPRSLVAAAGPSPTLTPTPTAAPTAPQEAPILGRDFPYLDTDELLPRLGFSWPVFRQQDWWGAW